MQETPVDSWVRKIPWRRDRLPTPVFLGFPCGSAGKESTCSAGDLGLISGLGRSPGEGKGYPLQYSGLKNSKDYTVYGVAKSRTRLSDFHFTTLLLSVHHSFFYGTATLNNCGGTIGYNTCLPQALKQACDSQVSNHSLPWDWYMAVGSKNPLLQKLEDINLELPSFILFCIQSLATERGWRDVQSWEIQTQLSPVTSGLPSYIS